MRWTSAGIFHQMNNIINVNSEESVPSQNAVSSFALVRGEAFNTLPRDLYIPPDALEVFLETFEGPLDLLLYLIKRQNLEILDIPVAEITRQYMVYIELMKGLQLELVAEYLVMAAMLAEIKSRMLLPRPPGVAEGEEGDPRAETLRRGARQPSCFQCVALARSLTSRTAGLRGRT